MGTVYVVKSMKEANLKVTLPHKVDVLLSGQYEIPELDQSALKGGNKINNKLNFVPKC